LREEVMNMLIKYKPNREPLDEYFYSELMEWVRLIPSPTDKSIQIRAMIEKKLLKEYNSYDTVYVQCYLELLDEIDNLPNQSQRNTLDETAIW
jgi:hypothetical protein